MDGLVLAGGRSRRFGSDKALAHFDSQALSNVAHAVFLLKAICQQVYVSCNPANREAIQDSVAGLAATVIVDREPVLDKGPISGLWAYFATLPRAHADVLIVACDYRGLSLSALAPLVGRFGYLVTPNGTHYTCCRLDVAFTTLEMQVLAKNWHWQELLEIAGCPPLNVSTPLLNVNYPEELPHADTSANGDG
ncbi:molybdenum cofactor guanylyltransferase [Lacticaseibacillus baoqingensis]|uniref:Molybdenum cofactor guanylyltransferase n=1 Tax=Lacticaseibacillus baoqingensis TaxID=2486013 RepID=A0ABW4EA26_9LACO|nr:molybdenum cofactor guanylyltransferase [Lacticaseibacillus baoqingensis]